MAKKKQARSAKSRSGYTDRELMFTVHPAIKSGGLASPRMIEEWEAKNPDARTTRLKKR